MSKKIDEEMLRKLLVEQATEKVLNQEISDTKGVEGFFDSLMQPVLQAMLDAELTNHLNYDKSKVRNNVKKEDKNYRNGHCKAKNIKTKYGNISVQTPRDRNGTFEPIIIGKGENSLSNFEEKCIALYAKGMSYRDIEKIMMELYGVKISKDQIGTIISSVSSAVQAWRNRPLKPFYSFVYADCMYVPIKDDYMSIKKAVYVLVGIDAEGFKDVLGIWVNNTESATMWCQIFGELHDRGTEDILYVCTDGIAGMKNSLETIFPKTNIQRCVVHLVRNLYSICDKKIAKEVVSNYKKIYSATTLEQAEEELEKFEEKYKKKEIIVAKVKANMQYLEPLFELPAEIRKCIYTTNIIESVNAALRKVTRGKGSFSSNETVYKVLFLRIGELEEKWRKPIKDWKNTQIQLGELFNDRYLKHIKI